MPNERMLPRSNGRLMLAVALVGLLAIGSVGFAHRVGHPPGDPGFVPIVLAHMEMGQQVIGEKLDRLQGQSS